jgi:APA family basic amino acid/polyamine antiporter
MAKIWTRKSIAALEAEAAVPEVQALTAHGGVPLKRTLSAVNLVSLGIGAIIGAGIFVLTGQPPPRMPVRRLPCRSCSAPPALSPACATPEKLPLCLIAGSAYTYAYAVGRVHRPDHRLGSDPRDTRSAPPRWRSAGPAMW